MQLNQPQQAEHLLACAKPLAEKILQQLAYRAIDRDAPQETFAAWAKPLLPAGFEPPTLCWDTGDTVDASLTAFLRAYWG